ncbi:MAG: N-formylglutamate amidohydrolase, partial [Myxococcota bacterium]
MRTIGRGSAASGARELVITCEHAGNRLPDWLDVRDSEQHWLETHWGYDIGAASVAETLVERFDTVGIFADFSRLVCDPNRPLESESWLRAHVEDDAPLAFNQQVSDEQRRERERLWQQYHAAVDDGVTRVVDSGGAPLLFSVHSMTHEYCGDRRDMELSVVFSGHENIARS